MLDKALKTEAEQHIFETQGLTITHIAARMREVAYAARTQTPLELDGEALKLDNTQLHQYLEIYADLIQVAELEGLSKLAKVFRDMAFRLPENIFGFRDLLENLADELERGFISDILATTAGYDLTRLDKPVYTRTQLDHLKKAEFKRGFDAGAKAILDEE